MLTGKAVSVENSGRCNEQTVINVLGSCSNEQRQRLKETFTTAFKRVRHCCICLQTFAVDVLFCVANSTSLMQACCNNVMILKLEEGS